jgi:hypothetical protein
MESHMPQYRLFLLDRNNHVVGAHERECPESDVKLVALDVLQNEAYSIEGVEIWNGTSRLDRVHRG